MNADLLICGFILHMALPKLSSLAEIEEIASRVARDPRVVCAFAGSPVLKPAADGLGFILSQSCATSLGATGGLTLIKSATAFTAPAFRTRATLVRRGSQVEHYAEVERASAADATHASYYPGPGEHLRPGMTQVIGGRTYRHYWRISRQMSDLIRQGEQEHLDDAQRAYDLTYGLICDAINSLAGQRFGPAANPDAATQVAERALASRLPGELGVNPANWAIVLDRLLRATHVRDTSGWHSISVDPPQTIGDKIIHRVTTTPATKIGQVPSIQVVNY
jgi:hypothetical protein